MGKHVNKRPIFSFPIGSVFGKWTVIAETVRPATWRQRPRQLCRCECGKVRPIRTSKLKDGTSLQCAYCARRALVGLNCKDIPPGTVIGFCTVLKRLDLHGDCGYKYLCRCICGTEREMFRSNIRTGQGCPCRRRKELTPFLQLFRMYRGRAKNSGRSFDISFDLFMEYIKKPCYYCGVEFSNTHNPKHGHEPVRYNGLDRVNSSIGYEPSNIVPCCVQCNYAKMDYTQNEFLAWARRVAEFNGWIKPGATV